MMFMTLPISAHLTSIYIYIYIYACVCVCVCVCVCMCVHVKYKQVQISLNAQLKVIWHQSSGEIQRYTTNEGSKFSKD